LGCKLTSTAMKANVDLWFDGSHTPGDPKRYRRLVENLIYLTVTRSDITFIVGVLNRFMHQSKEVHWTNALKILAHVKSSPEKTLLYKKYGHVRISETLILVMLVTKG